MLLFNRSNILQEFSSSYAPQVAEEVESFGYTTHDQYVDQQLPVHGRISWRRQSVWNPA